MKCVVLCTQTHFVLVGESINLVDEHFKCNAGIYLQYHVILEWMPSMPTPYSVCLHNGLVQLHQCVCHVILHSSASMTATTTMVTMSNHFLWYSKIENWKLMKSVLNFAPLLKHLLWTRTCASTTKTSAPQLPNICAESKAESKKSIWPGKSQTYIHVRRVTCQIHSDPSSFFLRVN